MNWELDTEHRDFRASCREFVNRQVRPVAEVAEQLGHPPDALWQEFGAAGLLGLLTPEEYGGSGGDPLAVAVLSEELARASGGIAVSALVSAYMAAPHIVHHGTDEQRSQYLPALVRGDAVAAIAVTESGAGSDVAAIASSAVRKGDDYLLNGRKMFITNAGLASVTIVAAKTSPAAGHRGISTFLLDADTPGLSLGKPLPKMGWHASDTREMVLDHVRVPRSALLGELDQGFYQIMRGFQLERIALAAMGLGHAAETLQLATEHARLRQAFGGCLASLQTVRHRLAAMSVELEAARLVVHRAAERLGNGHPEAARSVAMAKYHAAQAASRVVDDAVQILGGSGFVEESPVARHYRDVRVLRIGGGADEVQLEILSRELSA